MAVDVPTSSTSWMTESRPCWSERSWTLIRLKTSRNQILSSTPRPSLNENPSTTRPGSTRSLHGQGPPRTAVLGSAPRSARTASDRQVVLRSHSSRVLVTGGDQPAAGSVDRDPDRGGILQATLLIGLLLLIPSRLHVGPLGSAGTPAQLLALVLCLAWVLGRFQSRTSEAMPRLQPLHFALVAFVAASVASYVAAAARPIRGIELNAADRGMLGVVAWVGMFVMMSDRGPTAVASTSRSRGGSPASGCGRLAGVAEFVTDGPSSTASPRFLSATANSEFERRGTGRRPGPRRRHLDPRARVRRGPDDDPAARHIDYALHAGGRSTAAESGDCLAIAAAIPLSISRSAILLSVVVLVGDADADASRTGAGDRAAGRPRAVMYVAIPGLAGTFRGLFTGVSDRPALSRVPVAMATPSTSVCERPLFGRGLRTFLPDYRILDNQYLNILIEMGVVRARSPRSVGPVVLAIADGFCGTSHIPRRRASQPGVALAAAIAAGAISSTLTTGLPSPWRQARCSSASARCAPRRIVADELQVDPGYQLSGRAQP